MVDGQTATRPKDDWSISVEFRAGAAGGLCASQQVCEPNASADKQRSEALDRESGAQERTSQEEEAISRIQDSCWTRISGQGNNNTPEADSVVAIPDTSL